ncbi:MAG: NAD(P)/FAD-dependent oxidoreductase [Thiolinea sp.]
MAIEDIDTLVVGAGQAGIAVSEHLTRLKVPHLVVEKNRVAEAWRTARWDSLVANGPCWHDRFPNRLFQTSDQDAFVPKDEVAQYLCDYAKSFDAPIMTGTEVYSAQPNEKNAGFTVTTSQGSFQANRIIAATGAFQVPSIPSFVPGSAPVKQIHSHAYKNPGQLEEGAVLVIGAGSSGAQIAEELNRAGRKVYLSVGAHDRPPRSYRGRDNVWWLGVLGLWDAAAAKPGAEHVTIAVSGAYGGRTMDFRRLGHDGVCLLGVAEAYAEGVLKFKDNLKQNIADGDANYLSMLDEADAYIERNGLDFPKEPEARVFPADPECLKNPKTSLDLVDADIKTIIWATGYKQDFSWIKADTFDEHGKPIHQRGVARVQGIYFLGLPWQSRRGSTFIWGVWHDAKFIADQIAIQRAYASYRPGAGIPGQSTSD